MTATRIVLLALLAASGVAALSDLRTQKLPNRLLGVVGAVGVALHFAVYAALLHRTGESWLGLLGGAAANVASGVLVCTCVPFVLFRFRALGGGDVKLLACVGAFVGPLLGAQIELYAFLAAALYAPLRALLQGQLLTLARDTGALLVRVFSPEARKRPLSALTGELCFAPAVFAATALVVAQHWSLP